MKLVLLYGPPAVGKLSVAQALAARTGFRVLHNHLFIDLSHALFDPGTEASRAFARRLRDVSLDAARLEGPPGVVLTMVYARDRDPYILGLCNHAEAQGDEVVLVRLGCSVAALEARVAEPSRGAFNKLTTVAGLHAKLAELAEPFGAVRGRPSIGLETGGLSAAAVADGLVRRLELR